MDKLQAADLEGGPEKDGGMNFEYCAASIRYYLLCMHITIICNLGEL